MRFSDIKIGYIYTIIFDPVRPCEFNGQHLGLVLKKNNDKNTFIVMPLTSADNGDGINKIKLGQITSLPSSLRTNCTYAVFNQLRTVNATRFIKLKEDSNPIECPIDKILFNQLLTLGIRELTISLPLDQRVSLLKTIYENECLQYALDIAYRIKKNPQDTPILTQELKGLLDIISYKDIKLQDKQITDGIDKIFETCYNSIKEER